MTQFFLLFSNEKVVARVTRTANVRFKLRNSLNSKLMIDKNSSKQFLWMKLALIY